MKNYKTARQLRQESRLDPNWKGRVFQRKVLIKEIYYHTCNNEKFMNSMLVKDSKNNELIVDLINTTENLKKELEIGKKIKLSLIETWNVHYEDEQDYCFIISEYS